MDALWNLEDNLKVSTQEAVVFLACTAVLVVGLCTATAIRRWAKRKRSSVHQEPLCMEEPEEAEWLTRAEQPSWVAVKKVLMSSVRWSGMKKWEERRRERPTPLLAGARFETHLGWQSHNSTSPVWQRPILMGEKCELPRFSGLILYDERGRLVHHYNQGTISYQEESATAIRTTLRDLL